MKELKKCGDGIWICYDTPKKAIIVNNIKEIYTSHIIIFITPSIQRSYGKGDKRTPFIVSNIVGEGWDTDIESKKGLVEGCKMLILEEVKTEI